MLYWYLWVEFAMILAWTDAFPESEDGVWLPFTLSNALVYVAMLVGIQNYVKALIYMVYGLLVFPVYTLLWEGWRCCQGRCRESRFEDGGDMTICGVITMPLPFATYLAWMFG